MGLIDGRRFMDRRNHLLILLRPRYRQHIGVSLADQIGLNAQAASHDDASVGINGLANGAQ